MGKLRIGIATVFLPVCVLATTASATLHRPIFKEVDLKKVTLEEAILWIRTESKTLFPLDDFEINFVIDSYRLAPDMLQRRISYQAENVLLVDAIRDVTERAGVGFRVEPYAIVISTRAHCGIVAPPRPENLESAARFSGRPKALVIAISPR